MVSLLPGSEVGGEGNRTGTFLPLVPSFVALSNKNE